MASVANQSIVSHELGIASIQTHRGLLLIEVWRNLMASLGWLMCGVCQGMDYWKLRQHRESETVLFTCAIVSIPKGCLRKLRPTLSTANTGLFNNALCKKHVIDLGTVSRFTRPGDPSIWFQYIRLSHAVLYCHRGLSLYMNYTAHIPPSNIDGQRK